MRTDIDAKPVNLVFLQKRFLRQHEQLRQLKQLSRANDCGLADWQFFAVKRAQKGDEEEDEEFSKTLKPFQCDRCCRSFYLKKDLKRHEIKHFRARLDERFVTLRNIDALKQLEEHVITFRVVTALKRHKQEKVKLQEPHIVTVKNDMACDQIVVCFKCEMCAATFNNEDALALHVKSHTNK